MADVTLTAEQLAAITAEGPTLVRAGAGSGKTSVLAERYVYALAPFDGTPPRVASVNEILAITFTERAAAEMRRRIGDLVAVRAASAGPDDRRRWEGIRRDLVGAHISTIHALCARILRENPVEAVRDPRAVVLDEQAGRAWHDRVVGEALIDLVRAGDPGARALVVRAGGLRGGRLGGAVGACLQILDALGRAGLSAEWLTATTLKLANGVGDDRARCRDAIGELQEEVRKAVAARGKAPGGLAAWSQWAAQLDSLALVGSADEWPVIVGAARAVGGLRLGVGKDLLRLESPRASGRIAEWWGAIAVAGEAAVMAATIARVDEAIDARKRREGVLGFDDLVRGARDLLRDHPWVRSRYTRQLRVVLVDEFQDTDPVQADVVRSLTDGPEGGCVFVVGDEKQSIYRFRGADVTVFRDMRHVVAQALPLGRNFRSQAPILSFVNALATHVLRPPATGEDGHWITFDEGQRLSAHREATWDGPRVRLVTFAAEPERRAAEARVVEGRVLASVLQDLLTRPAHPVPAGDIAVLFRSLTQVKAYEYALRRRGVAYYVVKGRGFFQCDEVRDVASVLATIDDPDDGIALATVLRSPFVGLDDDRLVQLGGGERRLGSSFWGAERATAGVQADPLIRATLTWLARLRRQRSRATIAELIEEALRETSYEAVCLAQFQGAQRVANVRKVIELAREAGGRRGLSLGAFVAELDDLATREPREAEAALAAEAGDVVRLMTVHQAKGLEFPVVVLADLGRPRIPERATLVVDERYGLVVAPLMGAGGQTLRHARLEAHRAREQERADAESARVLYVACTRAREELILLEGRASRGYLDHGKGDRHEWTHLVWDTLGRDAVRAIVDGPDDVGVVEGADGLAVQVERAQRYRDAAGDLTVARAPADPQAVTTEARAAVLRIDAPVLGPVGLASVSPTALADFARCPRQYWYRHVVGLRERGSGGRRARVMGTAAHGVLESCDLAGAEAQTIGAQVERRPEAALLTAAERRLLARDVSQTAMLLQRECAEGLVILGREVPFVMGLPADRPRVFVQGRIDLMAQRGPVTIVRDYKWAREGEASADAHRDQLATYAVAAWLGGATHVAAEVVFMRDTSCVRPVSLGEPAAEAARLTTVALALAAVRGRDDLPAYPRGFSDADACRAIGCGYVAGCWRTRRYS